MKITHRQVSSKGFCPDLAPDTLPIGATSYSLNLKNTEEGWVKSSGFRVTQVSPTLEGKFLAYYSPTKGDDRWMVAGSTDIVMAYGGLSDSVGRDGGYSASGQDKWTAVDFNGVLILNNEVDSPQFFNSLEKFDNLSDFPANYRVRVLRKFGPYLLGLGVNLGSGFRDNDLLWSHPADPGTLPPNWDFSSASSDAGLTTLPSEGFIIDSLELGSSNIIYKADSIWTMRLTGGQYVFSFDKLFSGQGILSKDCVVQFEGKHFVLTQNDMIVHNGNAMSSVAEGRVRDFFFREVNPEFYDSTFVVTDPESSEILIMFADSTSEGACNRALVWDWRQDAWEFRSLPNVVHAGYGYELAGGAGTWEEAESSWDRDGTWMAPESLAQYAPVLHFLSDDYSEILAKSSTKNWMDEPIKSVWESDTCTIGPVDRFGVPQQNYDMQKTVTQLAFDVIGNAPFEVFIRWKGQLGDVGAWESLGVVEPSVDKRLDFMETADYFGIRIETEAHDFVLRSFHVEWFPAGEMW